MKVKKIDLSEDFNKIKEIEKRYQEEKRMKENKNNILKMKINKNQLKQKEIEIMELRKQLEAEQQAGVFIATLFLIFSIIVFITI